MTMPRVYHPHLRRGPCANDPQWHPQVEQIRAWCLQVEVVLPGTVLATPALQPPDPAAAHEREHRCSLSPPSHWWALGRAGGGLVWLAVER